MSSTATRPKPANNGRELSELLLDLPLPLKVRLRRWEHAHVKAGIEFDAEFATQFTRMMRDWEPRMATAERAGN